mmetsp:Transcript_7987/g.11624  ORF Transcript_7987/g.11624 Transcript_7987/m.11624 type:complete len:136 (+) Transcript_7987:177-584(+)
MTKWSEIAKQLHGRIGDQVKERWVNNLNPETKRGTWSLEEIDILHQAQAKYGNKWSMISKLLPGRSENSVKNRWYNGKVSERRARRKMLEGEADFRGEGSLIEGPELPEQKHEVCFKEEMNSPCVKENIFEPEPF